MGVGLRCRGALRRRPLWPFASREGLLERARGSVEAFAAAAGLAPCLSIVPQPGRLWIFLYPGEEPIALQRLESGGLACAAKTSTAGPGYHRLVVELMDRLGEDLGLDWGWDGDEAYEGDETGYGASRDFEQLQQHMAAFLRRLCGVLLHHLPARPTVVTGISPELGTPRAPGAISRLGPRPAALIREIAEASETRLLAQAADWFPWWDDGLTARAWRNLGLGLMWVELPWTPPSDAEERRPYQLALQAMDRAGALDPDLDLPAREIAEMGALLAAGLDPDRPPAPDGIGYRRGPLRIELGDGWSLEIPGYFRRSIIDGGLSLAFAYGPRLILATILSVEPRRAPIREDVAERLTPDSLVFEGPGGVSWIELERRDGDDGAPRLRLRGTAAAATGEAIVSVGFTDEADLDWAKEVFSSLRFESQAAGAA